MVILKHHKAEDLRLRRRKLIIKAGYQPAFKTLNKNKIHMVRLCHLNSKKVARPRATITLSITYLADCL